MQHTIYIQLSMYVQYVAFVHVNYYFLAVTALSTRTNNGFNEFGSKFIVPIHKYVNFYPFEALNLHRYIYNRLVSEIVYVCIMLYILVCVSSFHPGDICTRVSFSRFKTFAPRARTLSGNCNQQTFRGSEYKFALIAGLKAFIIIWAPSGDGVGLRFEETPEVVTSGDARKDCNFPRRKVVVYGVLRPSKELQLRCTNRPLRSCESCLTGE